MAKAKARGKTGRKSGGRVLKATTRQTGRSDLARDSKKIMIEELLNSTR